MAKTREVHDPFLNKTVQVSDDLVDRLRGKYAIGPTMPNGEPEFGWSNYPAPLIQLEAADEIERLKGMIDKVARAMTPDGYWVSGSRGFSWACKNLKGCPTVTICAGINRCMTKQQSNLRWRELVDWLEQQVSRPLSVRSIMELDDFYKQTREKIAALRAKERDE